jgi:phage shock protein PspC (stress-responsive transcriptional regulator)
MEKRLYRSRNKKVVAGIAGGLGDYLDVDPVIIRIIIVLITIFHGVGLLIYIIMWIVIPEEQYDTSKKSAEPLYAEDTGQKTESNFAEGTNTSSQPEKSSNGRIIFGVILIFIGLIFLFERFIPFFDFEFIFAIGLVALGLALIFNFFNKAEKSS